MIIGPSAQVDRSRYEKGEGELDVFYGLPRDVKFCVRCNMSNQQPMSSNEYSHGKQSTKTTMSFDEEGVCHACRFNDMKRDGEIDWDERERELLDLCDRYRKNDGSYDCIVGGSGGKDSAMQSHLLKYKYGMHPLTVTWSPHLYTDIDSITTSTPPTGKFTACSHATQQSIYCTRSSLLSWDRRPSLPKWPQS